MDVILSDRKLTAQEALQFGLVSRVAPVERYLTVAIEVATAVAAKSPQWRYGWPKKRSMPPMK